jgi:hypothetical protein
MKDALDRHVPVQEVDEVPPDARALLEEAQNLRVELIDLAETLDDVLEDLQVRLSSRRT